MHSPVALAETGRSYRQLPPTEFYTVPSMTETDNRIVDSRTENFVRRPISLIETSNSYCRIQS